MSLVIKKDFLPSANSASLFGDFILQDSFRITGLWVRNTGEFGRSLGVYNSVLSGLYAIKELIALPEVIQEGWRSTSKNICSLVVCIGYALETPGIPFTLAAKVSRFVPWCNAAYYAQEFFENLSVVRGVETSQNTIVIEAAKLKKKLHKWELVKNSFLWGASVISLVGVALSSYILFAIAIGAFIAAMFAHFARSKMVRYSIEKNVLSSI